MFARKRGELSEETKGWAEGRESYGIEIEGEAQFQSNFCPVQEVGSCRSSPSGGHDDI